MLYILFYQTSAITRLVGIKVLFLPVAGCLGSPSQFYFSRRHGVLLLLGIDGNTHFMVSTSRRSGSIKGYHITDMR